MLANLLCQNSTFLRTRLLASSPDPNKFKPVILVHDTRISRRGSSALQKILASSALLSGLIALASMKSNLLSFRHYRAQVRFTPMAGNPGWPAIRMRFQWITGSSPVMTIGGMGTAPRRTEIGVHK